MRLHRQADSRWVFLLSLCLASTVAFAQRPFYTKVENVAALRQLFAPASEALPQVSAHRGGPYPGFPENCLATFENVLTFVPAIIECDVRMTRDSVLVMMHDETLDRTTNGSGKVDQQNWAELRSLRLVDSEQQVTSYAIPTFDEVLAWAVGRAVLTVDVKKGVPFERIVAAIRKQQAEAYAVVITYSIRDARQVHALHPELMLSVTMRNEEELAWAEGSGIPLSQMVAFVGLTEPPKALYKKLHQEGVACILGTMGNLDRRAKARGGQVYRQLVKNGADILSTDRPIEAAAVLEKSR